MRRFAIVAALTANLMPACQAGGEPPPVVTATATVEPTSSFPLHDTQELLAMSRGARFRAPDGVVLEGRIFGHGDVGIVLAHMGVGDQGQWWDLAGLLADRGYSVLTYNRRGSCPGGDLGCSQGEDIGDGWKDVVGAVGALRAAGAERVAVGGASQGAMESLYAVAKGGAEADGLLWVAGADLYRGLSAERLVRDLRGPKLFIAGTFDDPFGELAKVLQRVAFPPKQLLLLDTGEHGTDILAYEEPVIADSFRQAVLDFMAAL